MKEPFVENECVAAYNCSKRYVGIIRAVDMRSGFPLLVIETDDDTMTFNPKQCRRLKKKEKRKPREVWIDWHCLNHLNNSMYSVSSCISKNKIMPSDVLFREVIE